MTKSKLSPERYNAICDHAINNRPLGANKHELESMVRDLANAVLYTNAMFGNEAQGVLPTVWLTKEEALNIAGVINSLQAALAINAPDHKFDHKLAIDAIKLLMPKRLTEDVPVAN